MAGFRGSAARAVLGRPGLWPTALRQVRRLARPGWWRRPPFLPVPDPDYLAFRLETQYGGASITERPVEAGAGDRPAEASGERSVAEDLVSYLQWCRDQDREIRHRPPRTRR